MKIRDETRYIESYNDSWISNIIWGLKNYYNHHQYNNNNNNNNNDYNNNNRNSSKKYPDHRKKIKYKKVTVVPIINKTLGTVPKSFAKKSVKLNIRKAIRTILLQINKQINKLEYWWKCWNIEETWCHLIFSENHRLLPVWELNEHKISNKIRIRKMINRYKENINLIFFLCIHLSCCQFLQEFHIQHYFLLTIKLDFYLSYNIAFLKRFYKQKLHLHKSFLFSQTVQRSLWTFCNRYL